MTRYSRHDGNAPHLTTKPFYPNTVFCGEMNDVVVPEGPALAGRAEVRDTGIWPRPGNLESASLPGEG